MIEAFISLAQKQRYSAIRTQDVVVAAAVGRSTFYEHFQNKDDILVAALDPILLALANAASNRASQTHTRAILEHIWDRRAQFRSLLVSSGRQKISRALAGMIENRLDKEGKSSLPTIFQATARAAAQLAILQLWVTGEARCTIDQMAKQIRFVANETS